MVSGATAAPAAVRGLDPYTPTASGHWTRAAPRRQQDLGSGCPRGGWWSGEGAPGATPDDALSLGLSSSIPDGRGRRTGLGTWVRHHTPLHVPWMWDISPRPHKEADFIHK